MERMDAVEEMIVTIVFTGINLGAAATMLFNWRILGPTKVGNLRRFGKLVGVLEPGIHHLLPFESVKIFDTRQWQNQVPATDLAVIGKDNMVCNIDTQLICSIFDSMKFELNFQGDLDDALATLVEGSLTMALIQMKENPFDSEVGKSQLYAISKKLLIKAAASWGIRINQYLIQKIYPPETVLAKTAAIVRAEGEAKAILVVNSAVNEVYTQQKSLQQQDYMKLQALQTLKETLTQSAAGGLRTFVLGGDPMNSLLTLLEDGEKHEN